MQPIYVAVKLTWSTRLHKDKLTKNADKKPHKESKKKTKKKKTHHYPWPK